MYLKSIKILNFRNYTNTSVNFKNGINIIYGNNGQGKTNLLESIYFLALTKSFKTLNDKDIINKENSFTYLNGLLIEKEEISLEIGMDYEEKKLKINKKEILKISDYLNNMFVIVFYPEDLILIKGSPKERRRYLNIAIGQLEKTYIDAILDFNKILKMKNDLLKKNLSNIKIDFSYYDIINNIYIQKCHNIIKIRYKYIKSLNNIIYKTYQDLTGLKNFKLIYNNNLNVDFNDEKYKELYKIEAEKLYYDEIKSGKTLFGPHLDDYDFIVEGNNLKKFGSQGQQRMAVITLKLAEFMFLEKIKKTSPILLMDDVFSELDDEKKNNLLKFFEKKRQIIITTTNLDNIDKNILNKSNIIKIENAKIEEVLHGK